MTDDIRAQIVAKLTELRAETGRLEAALAAMDSVNGYPAGSACANVVHVLRDGVPRTFGQVRKATRYNADVLRHALKDLVRAKDIHKEGTKRACRYVLGAE